jgi:signal transduction histidine kinase
MALDGLLPDMRVGLTWDLRDQLERWSRSTGIAVEVWALPGEPPPRVVEGLVRATILDALDEWETDGSVRCVGIALTLGPRGLRLTISGDGSGRPQERLAERLRVRRAGFAGLGGGLSMNAVPGGGVTVSAALPARAFGAISA